MSATFGMVGAATASTLTYQVTNYDHDGTKGLYVRNSANINDVARNSAHYLTYGVSVRLECAAFGSAVGPKNNTAWDKVTVLTGNRAGLVGYLSEHWLNTPVGNNQHVSGEPACSPTPPPAPVSTASRAAINWATGKMGSTAWNGECLSFVRNAYASGGVDLRREVSVSWGSNTYPQDIWNHFTGGRTGTGTPPPGALAFFLARSGYSKTYSHITIAVDASGNTISTNDTVNKSAVHRETVAQHQASRAYNTYVGWWLP